MCALLLLLLLLLPLLFTCCPAPGLFRLHRTLCRSPTFQCTFSPLGFSPQVLPSTPVKTLPGSFYALLRFLPPAPALPQLGSTVPSSNLGSHDLLLPPV